jgi:thiol-disulfide isomerase/thioredoxin
MSDDVQIDEASDLGSTRWRWGTGILSALAVGLVVFGMVLFSERGNSTPSDSSGPARPAAQAGGEIAFPFELTFFDGAVFSLEEHLSGDGRPVFLNFWASWCPPCRAEMPDISEAADRYPDVMFIGVAVSDDEAPARQYADEVQVSYPLGFDTTGVIEAHYPSPGLPATFLISSSGEIVRTYVGQMSPALIEELIGELTGARAPLTR